MNRVGGIYLHIPFCRKACVYCDFHFSTQLKSQSEMVLALEAEMALRVDYLGADRPIQSVYFGGGTPSLLSLEQLSFLLDKLQQRFLLQPEAEITLEANPDDLHPAYLQGLQELGVNRLSVGIQSFAEADLQWMNRSHKAGQARQVLQDLQTAGFASYSLDLIFGLAGQSQTAWQQNLESLLAFAPPHVSIYGLTVEPKTALAHQLTQHPTLLPDEASYEAQFLLAHELLTQAGYEHYEVSSYALPGHRARHNAAYWQQRPYLGLGPSAHSFDGHSRSWNVKPNAAYLKTLSQGQSPVAQTEQLSPQDHYHEYIMTQLRKVEGLSPSWIQQHYLPDWEKRFARPIGHWADRGLLYERNGQLALTPQGWLIADQIIRDFFLE